MERSWVLVAGLFAAAAAEAAEPLGPAPPQAPAQTPAATSPEPARRPPRRDDEGTFILRDGRRLVGRLLTTSSLGDVIALAEGGRAFLPGNSVVAVIPKGEPPPAWAALPPDGVLVRLRDGSVVEGKVAGRGEETVEVESGAGERRSLLVDEIAEAVVPGGPLSGLRSRAAVAQTRALWAPTAFLLRPGEILATASALQAASVGVGILPVAMLSAGTTVPASYARDFGTNVSLDARIGFEVLPWLHVAGGAEAYLSTEGDLLSAYAALTAGWPDRYLTVFAGPPPPGAQHLGRFGDQIAAAAACWRLGARVALLAEGWLGPASLGHEKLGALGARFLWDRFSLDVGAATAAAETFVPFLSLSVDLRSP